MKTEDRLWLPVDVSSLEEARRLIGDLIPAGIKQFKIGLELTTAVGSVAAVECVKSMGGEVWYDGKFCDIPNTVAGASRAVVALGVNMFNVHASSGRVAMTEAAKHKGNSKLLAVTVLTSLSYGDVLELWYPRDEPYEIPTPDPDNIGNAGKMRKIVLQMTWAAYEAGADGVVCSPQELAELSTHEGFRNLMKVTPGVRPSWASAYDQKRVMTPTEAIKAGATALVIGRPITNPPKEIGTPADAAKRIFDEIAGAL